MHNSYRNISSWTLQPQLGVRDERHKKLSSKSRSSWAVKLIWNWWEVRGERESPLGWCLTELTQHTFDRRSHSNETFHSFNVQTLIAWTTTNCFRPFCSFSDTELALALAFIPPQRVKTRNSNHVSHNYFSWLENTNIKNDVVSIMNRILVNHVLWKCWLARRRKSGKKQQREKPSGSNIIISASKLLAQWRNWSLSNDGSLWARQLYVNAKRTTINPQWHKLNQRQ